MTPGRRRLLMGLAALLAVSGGLGIVGVLSTGGSVRGWIRGHYSQVSSANGGRSLVYAAATAPVVTADRIAGRWRPADRVNDPAGVFLRYSGAMVAVTSDGGRGSRIYVDDERTGYTRWYPYVGGWWGTYSGAGEGFRGGGPGAGK